jgi:hypothetical protein
MQAFRLPLVATALSLGDLLLDAPVELSCLELILIARCGRIL